MLQFIPLLLSRLSFSLFLIHSSTFSSLSLPVLSIYVSVSLFFLPRIGGIGGKAPTDLRLQEGGNVTIFFILFFPRNKMKKEASVSGRVAGFHSLSVRLSVCGTFALCLCLCVCFRLYLWLCICLFVHLSVCLCGFGCLSLDHER